MPISLSDIQQKVRELAAGVERAAQKAGRRPEDVTVVAVTKGVAPEAVRLAREAGLAVFGENRVQEAEAKIPALADAGAEWHLIGHLQSNKVKTAVELFSVIQSVDSVRLARLVGEEAAARQKPMSILLEVNISGESQKYGFKPEALYGAVEEISALGTVKVAGLMGIAPHSPDPDPRRAAFKKLKGLYTVCKGLKYPNVEMKWLSMGMSDDYETAIEEGANMIRVGRAIFR